MQSCATAAVFLSSTAQLGGVPFPGGQDCARPAIARDFFKNHSRRVYLKSSLGSISSVTANPTERIGTTEDSEEHRGCGSKSYPLTRQKLRHRAAINQSCCQPAPSVYLCVLCGFIPICLYRKRGRTSLTERQSDVESFVRLKREPWPGRIVIATYGRAPRMSQAATD